MFDKLKKFSCYQNGIMSNIFFAFKFLV